MLIFVLYSKAPHAQNAHLFDPGHVCKCFFSQHQGPRAPAHQDLAVTPEQGERGRLRVGRLQVGAKALGWNSSSHTGFLPAVRARAEVGARPGLPAVDTKRTPKDPATPYTHRFPPRPPRGSRGSLRPACIYAAGQGHAGKSEARGACAALASGTR